MLRRSFIALLLLCSTAAVADGPPRQIVVGQGVAVSEDRREGEFEIRAAKVLLPAGPRIEGKFRFATGNRETNTLIVVESQVGRLVVDGHNAAFAGPGVMVIRRGDSVRRISGTVEGRCADLHVPTNSDDRRDTIGFQFTSRSGETFRFAGAVRRGDIHIATIR